MRPDVPLRAVITSDLDQTLIFSPRATARLGGGLPAEPVDVVEGDVFRDPLSADHDAWIVANTAHALSVPHNLELSRKMCQSRRSWR